MEYCRTGATLDYVNEGNVGKGSRPNGSFPVSSKGMFHIVINVSVLLFKFHTGNIGHK